ncbi:MAG TPA: hypothetical protein VF468_10500, partial [Actinomycetota bacterium]|nr:hypothetical protein [Actinomycetota bacterium]
MAVTVAVAVAAMLLVRRRAPEGSFFNDGDRASGVFGVLATGFSLLLGLIVVYMLFFADSGERAVVQGLLMGSVVAVMVATLLLIRTLDAP